MSLDIKEHANQAELTPSSSSANSDHTVIPVLLATSGAIFLSILTASIFAVLISFAMMAFDWIDFSGAESFEEKMKLIGEIKTVSVAAGVLGTSSALLFVGIALSGRPWSRALVRLRLFRPRALDVFWVTVGMLGLTHALGALIYLLGFEQTGSLAEFHQMFEAWTVQDKLVMLPVLALCPGIAEEVFFRGYALKKLELARGFTFALIVTSVLFGLIHFDTIHSVAAGIMGLYLAFAVRLTGSLWTTIFAHIVNNAAAVLFPNLIPASFNSQLLTFMLGLLSCGLALFFLKRSRAEPEPHVPQW